MVELSNLTPPMNDSQLKELLEELHDKYNRVEFIEPDPISVPHLFSLQEDIEISGFLAATIAWGNRKAIVKSARRMVDYMDGQPYDFTVNASENELKTLSTFVHRTFNGGDFISFVKSLRRFYTEYKNMGSYFEDKFAIEGDMRKVISGFRTDFFACEHLHRCEKHLSSIDKKAACKRTNMFLRWMVRQDDKGVDFGLWSGIPMSALYLPLDVHSGKIGRSLGLLTRTQSDWRAVEEITENLRKFDPTDPVKYDFALFGFGINKGE